MTSADRTAYLLGRALEPGSTDAIIRRYLAEAPEVVEIPEAPAGQLLFLPIDDDTIPFGADPWPEPHEGEHPDQARMDADAEAAEWGR